MSDRTSGYSLWFVPEGEAGERLEAFIAQLAGKLGTPSFPPHVTLLGQIREDKASVIGKSARLAASLEALTINLKGVGYEDAFFRCLYLIAEKKPALMSANSKARELFGMTESPPFMPHLSLVYGNMSVKDKKDIIAEMISLSECSFRVRKLSLRSTAGLPHEWFPVEDFFLS